MRRCAQPAEATHSLRTHCTPAGWMRGGGGSTRGQWRGRCAVLPSPTPARLATSSLSSTPTPLTRASPASSSADSGSPASPTPIPVAAVYDEHSVCARNHASRERHGHQQARDRGIRMGLGRGNVPDSRRRPRGCRWPVRPTAATSSSSCVRRGRSRAQRPRRPAVGTGANYAPARQPSLRPLRPPDDRARTPPCSNV